MKNNEADYIIFQTGSASNVKLNTTSNEHNNMSSQIEFMKCMEQIKNLKEEKKRLRHEFNKYKQLLSVHQNLEAEICQKQTLLKSLTYIVSERLRQANVIGEAWGWSELNPKFLDSLVYHHSVEETSVFSRLKVTAVLDYKINYFRTKLYEMQNRISLTNEYFELNFQIDKYIKYLFEFEGQLAELANSPSNKISDVILKKYNLNQFIDVCNEIAMLQVIIELEMDKNSYEVINNGLTLVKTFNQPEIIKND